jgi:hypothetical protein
MLKIMRASSAILTMPNLTDATHWQRAVASGVAARLGTQPQYTGLKDDCYKLHQVKLLC